MNLTYWRYFLSLEEDFIKSTRYVELCEDNYNTYSIEYTRLLVSICAEIEIILKLLCNEEGGDASRFNINELREFLYTKQYSKLHENNISILSHDIEDIKPWGEWSKPANNLEWWQVYNGIKHSTDVKFKYANLKNVFFALSALFIIELYLYDRKYNVSPSINSALYDYRYFGEALTVGPQKKIIYPEGYKRDIN